MTLHGLYKNGNIILHETDLPQTTAEVDIVFKESPWLTKVRKAPVRETSITETIRTMRDEA